LKDLYIDKITKTNAFTINSDKISLKSLTPFQGNITHRVYGKFKCSKCKNTWESGASWCNKYQKCKKCESKIYPFIQHVLTKNNNDNKNISLIPHDMSRCEMCIEKRQICCPTLYKNI